jgi:ribosome-interacting GTPase 1
MPTNVTPEYKKAEAAFRKARAPDERLQWLKEMLRVIPKHKGTEHVQADIKSRIKELTQELAGPRKKGARTGPVHTIRPEGAAQIALLGPPNGGKSTLHARLTGSAAEIGPYPHTTQAPLPGMLFYEDIQFQLVDLPPIATDFMESWMPNAVQPASAAILVIDLSVPGCVENVVAIRERLEAKRVTLTDDWAGRLGQGLIPAVDEEGRIPAPPALLETVPPRETSGSSEPELLALDDPFRTILPTLLLANKIDLGWDLEEIEILEDLVGARYPALAVSAQSGQGLAHVGRLLFQGLGIVRVYTKIPGKPPDKQRPYTVFAGDTVQDVAQLIHKEIAQSLRFAKVWGSAKFDGQQVGKEYVVSDGDVLELHA